jgi:hypothetical protein
MELAEDPAGIPPWPDVDTFIRNLDRTLGAPRRGASELVLFTEKPPGRDSARMLRGLRDHCTGDGRVLAPRVLLTVRAGDGLVGLVDECAAGLRTLPPGAGRLRLSQYGLLRRVLAADGLPDGPVDRARLLRRTLYQAPSREELNGELTDRLPGPLSWLGGLLGLLVWVWRVRVGQWLFGLRTNRRMTGRRSWFARWSEAQSGNPCTDFFAEAHHLAPGGRRTAPAPILPSRGS